MADHGEVEATRDLGKSRGCSTEGRIEHARFRGNSRLFRARLEPADRFIGSLAVLLALQFDQVGGNAAAERAVGDHRLVDERDARDMRTERGRDRNRILRRKVARRTAGKVDNDVLEHGSTSLHDARACGNPRHPHAICASLSRLGRVATRVSSSGVRLIAAC